MIKLLTALSVWLTSLLWPQAVLPFAHRAVLLDCGRKYYTKDWILSLTELMEQAGANELILHFSDDMGLRLESRQYPWLAGSDNAFSLDPSVADPDPGRFLSQEEILEIGAAARKRGIELIPSFDSPGHLRYVLEKYRQHTGQAISMPFAPSCLDFTNAKGREFIQSLIREYGQLFARTGSTQFDIGGDEVFTTGQWRQALSWTDYAQQVTGDLQADAHDGFTLYMNETDALVRQLGYSQTRMYSDMVSDEGIVRLSSRIDVAYWTLGPLTPAQIEKRHRVLNYLNFYLYYILDPDLSYPGVDPAAIEREWTPDFFLHWPNSQVSGSAFCIWSDIPGSQSQEEVMAGIRGLIMAWGKKNGHPGALKPQ